MKNKDKIIILKAKIIKLKEQLKEARLELADRDNEKPTPSQYDDAIDSLDRAFKLGMFKLFEDNKDNFLKLEVSSLTEKYKPIEPITPPITPPTKENIDYDFGG